MTTPWIRQRNILSIWQVVNYVVRYRLYWQMLIYNWKTPWLRQHERLRQPLVNIMLSLTKISIVGPSFVTSIVLTYFYVDVCTSTKNWNGTCAYTEQVVSDGFLWIALYTWTCPYYRGITNKNVNLTRSPANSLMLIRAVRRSNWKSHSFPTHQPAVKSLSTRSLIF